MAYLVKVRFRNGESITFVSNKKEDTFPNLSENEFLYFDAEQHSLLLYALILDGASWARAAFREGSLRDDAVNFLIMSRREQLNEYVGLTRDEAASLALQENKSFRVVYSNGQEMPHENDVSDNRVNVFLNNQIVYRAEIF